MARRRSGARQSGGDLEVGDCRRVVAEERQDLRQRLVELDDVRIAERERRLEMFARLPVGEDGTSVLAGQAMRAGRFWRSAGEALVMGNERPPCRIVARGVTRSKGFRHSSMEKPAASQPDSLVGHVTEPAVAEVVTHVAPDRRRISTMSPRRTSSSRPAIASSSLRPLAVRTVASSKERPMTAAAVRSWRASSPVAPIREWRSATTPPGVGPPTGVGDMSASAMYRGRPSDSAYRASETSAASGPSDAVASSVDRGSVKPAQSDPDRKPVALGTRDQPIPDLVRDLLRAPCDEQQDRPPPSAGGQDRR